MAWTPSTRAAVARFRAERRPWDTASTWAVVRMSRVVMQTLNTVEMHGRHQFHAARSTGRGLLTFSNHVSLFDDPLLTSCFAATRLSDTRWIAADALNFFGDAARAALFNTGRAVPVVRGAGTDQPGMHFLAERLREGDWVHVFPEGGRTRDPHAALRSPFKPGMALLIKEARPLLLPFRHWGMEKVLPIGARIPTTGKHVRLTFGHITDSDAGLADHSVAALTTWAEDQLIDLEPHSLCAAEAA